ncbi:MAG: extracellular solute-binding protein [Alphaproteobacteria bacterium]|nr:extracellular solute-binding protein [Alphaproteobacteria bacterium]
MTSHRIAGLAFGAALAAALVVPAQAQQRVSVYTAHTANIVETLIPHFEKATGMKADVVKAGSGDIINRVRAEAANPKADVIWSIGAELLEANADLLEPYTPKEYDQIADAFKGGKAWLPYTGIVNVIMVNTRKLKPEDYPKSWADLANPKYKNQISFAAADKSGSAYMQLNTFLTIYGDNDAGWAKFKSVFSNLNISNSSGAVPRFVNDGEAAIGVTLEDNAWLFVKGGGPVAILYPEDGTSAIADGMALVKRAPNAAAGKVFLDWAISAPVQELVVQELGRRPIRKDAKPMGSLKPLNQIKLVNYDIKKAADKRKEYMAKWNDLMLTR